MYSSFPLYILDGQKTIAVNQSTWQWLKKLMKKENAKDFDHLNILVQKSGELPSTMFGVDRQLHIYTQDEHDEFAGGTSFLNFPSPSSGTG